MENTLVKEGRRSPYIDHGCPDGFMIRTEQDASAFMHHYFLCDCDLEIPDYYDDSMVYVLKRGADGRFWFGHFSCAEMADPEHFGFVCVRLEHENLEARLLAARDSINWVFFYPQFAQGLENADEAAS